MFERFTDRARRAVVLAQEEARKLHHWHIGTEHLLLGLIDEGEGIAAQILGSLGLEIDAMRSQVELRVGTGADAPRGHIPFTPRAKQVLELSLRESLRLGHRYIGTEHILLGILREGEGVAAQVLHSTAPGGLERIEDELMTMLAGTGAIGAERRPQIREQAAATARTFGFGPDEELLKRLEAIEARLSSIDRMLREERGETG